MAPSSHNLKPLLLLPRIQNIKRSHNMRIKRHGCFYVDWFCWIIGYFCTAWWFFFFVYNFLPNSNSNRDALPGDKLKKEGLKDFHPVVFVPGFFVGELELWQGKTCAQDLFRNRVWGGGFGDIFKRPECWKEHMMLNKESGLDPPGIRVRPVPGLLTSGCFMGLIENLAKIGYEEKNMYMADYDWRLSFQNTEVRDNSLNKLKSKIELMVKTNGGKKVVVVPYSVGSLYFLHFLKWVEAPTPIGGGGGPNWCSQFVKAVMNVAPPFLGLPKAMPGIFSKEDKEKSFVIRSMIHGALDSNFFGFQALQHITYASQTWDSMHYLMPKGGNSIWAGGSDLPVHENLDCDVRNKRNATSLSMNNKQSSDNLRDCNIGGLVSMMAHYVKIVFLGKLSWVSLNLPFAESKELVVDPEIIQMESTQLKTNTVSKEIKDGINASANNKTSASNTVNDKPCFAAQDKMRHAQTHVSFGIADDLDDPKYNHYKYWSNPLETRLPEAPDTEIYCLYGVDSSQENSNDIGNEIVPLLSSGFMCARGWREISRFNPSSMRTYLREYKQANSKIIAQNAELIEDVMRVAAGASGEDIGGDQIYSDIQSISSHANIHPG